jgi:two-component system CheB/CheR fusion protein
LDEATQSPADLSQPIAVHDSGDDVIASEASNETPSGLLPFPIVGVGASAGGLEAYRELLAAMAPDTGMAFVLISHLSPEHESHLVEILARRCPMPVHEIRQGVAPEPNNVYVIPRGTRVALANGKFFLEARNPTGPNPMAIDHFFRSLAAHQKHRAIGVVLSGMDNDGSLGLTAIKGEGGIAIVQSPESALFAAMPRSGIAVDHVDLILPPAQIAVELGLLARQFQSSGLLALEQRRAAPDDAQHITRILSMLRSVSGIDFRLYKSATIRRRIARRMLLNKIDRLVEYVEFLQRDPQEVKKLHEDVLINVTRFFRDPEVFEAVGFELLPSLLSDHATDRPVRLWVAGCSTGEEVYSLAICLLEYFANHKAEPAIQIFGTDANEFSVEKARQGIYPESISADVSADRLHRFFIKTENGYQVSKRLRDLCIFARHNLCSDPPFSRLDLISCRNVLIYLGAKVQKHILQTVNYALRPGGYLLLGSSESIREHSELFLPTNRQHRFYQRVGSMGLSPDFVPPSFSPDLAGLPHRDHPMTSDVWSEVETQRAADRLILTRYGPAGVVINSKMDVLQVRGHTSPYLEHSPGAPTFNLLRMAKNGLAPALRDAVQRAISDKAPVKVDGIRLRERDRVLQLSIEILPIQNPAPRETFYLVVFLAPPDRGVALTESNYSPEPAVDDDERAHQIVRLREDLGSTQLYLHSLIEERDARNQELISAYEEIQSSNEELQSSNEELETAKEELQSINEELQTINEELRTRNADLLQAGNDLLNLLNSVNIPVLMLASDLTIRHFTPPAERLMHVRSSDIGRRITEIRLNLATGDIESVLLEVLDTLGTKELEVQDRHGRWHMLRIRPYRTAENRIEGLVLVLVDIDQIRRAENALREARDMAQSVIECVLIPLVVLDRDLRVTLTNVAFRDLAALEKQSIERRSFPEFVSLAWGMKTITPLLKSLAEGGPDFNIEHSTAGEDPRDFHINGRAVQLDGGPALLLTVEDITSRKQADLLIERERQRLQAEIERAQAELERTQGELRALTGSLFTSQEAERRRVARELHDDIGQRLAMLASEAEQLHQQSLHQQASDLSENLRRISHALHPSMLEDLGLASALRSLVTEFAEREGMPADFNHRHVPAQLPIEVAGTLYRISQEALRNVSKHAGRTHVRVSLTGSKSGLRLVVRDLGEGFNPSETRGLGLISMEERARLIGASFRVTSSPREGTTVQVQAPLEAAEDAVAAEGQGPTSPFSKA